MVHPCAPLHGGTPLKYSGTPWVVRYTLLTSTALDDGSSETLPQKFNDGTIVHIYKRKGNKRSRDNHRGISLLSIAGKIMACVLLNCLLKHLE